jgi:hypothetical protein
MKCRSIVRGAKKNRLTSSDDSDVVPSYMASLPMGHDARPESETLPPSAGGPPPTVPDDVLANSAFHAPNTSNYNEEAHDLPTLLTGSNMSFLASNFDSFPERNSSPVGSIQEESKMHSSRSSLAQHQVLPSLSQHQQDLLHLMQYQLPNASNDDSLSAMSYNNDNDNSSSNNNTNSIGAFILNNPMAASNNAETLTTPPTTTTTTTATRTLEHDSRQRTIEWLRSEVSLPDLSSVLKSYFRPTGVTGAGMALSSSNNDCRQYEDEIISLFGNSRE